MNPLQLWRSRKNKIVFRYLSASLCVLLVSFVLLGSLVFVFTSRYAYAETIRRLYVSIDSIFDMAPTLRRQPGDLLPNFLDFSIASVSADSTTYIAFLDAEGRIVRESPNGLRLRTTDRLPENICTSLLQTGLINGDTDLGGFFRESRFVAGRSMLGLGIPGLGAVILSAPTTGYGTLTAQLLQTIFFCTVVVLLLTVILLYAVTSHWVRPIHEMNTAVTQYAQKNFRARLPVEGGDELAELSAGLNTMANKLSHADELQKNFVASVAHDLRTPITSIQGFADSILDGTIPADKQQPYLERISSETRRLSRLVSSLLELSSLETDATPPKLLPLDIGELMLQVLFSLEAPIRERKLQVSLDIPEEPVLVLAEEDSMHRVIYNLVHNAQKFSVLRGEIRLSVQTDSTRTTVKIYNEGPGIAPEDLPHVFDRMYKTDRSRGKDTQGLGLGLYIVQLLVNRNGGTITAHSVKGRYCEFILTLPNA